MSAISEEALGNRRRHRTKLESTTFRVGSTAARVPLGKLSLSLCCEPKPAIIPYNHVPQNHFDPTHMVRFVCETNVEEVLEEAKILKFDLI